MELTVKRFRRGRGFNSTLRLSGKVIVTVFANGLCSTFTVSFLSSSLAPLTMLSSAVEVVISETSVLFVSSSSIW
jgi:hypothetical protein